MNLTLLTLLPVAGAILLLLLPRTNLTLPRITAAALSLVTLAYTILLWLRFDHSSSAYQFVERHTWIAALHVDYHLAVDGIGLLMVLLAAIVIPIGIAASWRRFPLNFCGRDNT